MSEDQTTYICSLCKSSADLFCGCSKVFLCAACVGSHLLKNFSVKHRPVLISEYLSSAPHPNPSKPDLKSAIHSKISNEILELEEFRKISLQKISEMLQLAEKQLLETVEKIMNDVSDEVENVQRDLKTALATLKLPDSYSNSILSLFETCNSVDEVRELNFVQKDLDLKYFSMESLIKERISFNLQVLLTPSGDKRDLTPELLSRVRSISGHARTCTMISDKDEELNFGSNTLVKHQSFKQKGIAKFNVIRSITPKKGLVERGVEIELKNQNPVKLEKGFEQKEVQKSWALQVLPYFYSNSNRFALFEVNDASLKVTDVPNKFFLTESAWSLCEGGRIVQTGGFDTSPRGDVFIYNLVTASVERTGQLATKRYKHSQVSLADFVYVIGGCNKGPLKTVERMNLLDFKWKTVGKLNIARTNPACCTHNTKLYIAGGEETKSVELFNTITKKFVLLSLLLPGSGNWGIFSYDDRILLLKQSFVYEWDGSSSNIKKTGQVDNKDWLLKGEPICTKNEIFFISHKILYRYDLTIGKILPVQELE